MKYLKFLLFLGISALISCTSSLPEGTYRIEGSIKGMNEGAVKLVSFDFLQRRNIVLDSTELSNGKFAFSGSAQHSDRASIQFGENSLDFMLENSAIDIRVDLDKPKNRMGVPVNEIKGGPLQSLYNQFNEEMNAILYHEDYEGLNAIRDSMMSIDRNTKEGKEKRKKLVDQLYKMENLSIQRYEKIMDHTISFSKDYADSPIGPITMGFTYSESGLSREELKEVYEAYSGEAKNTSSYKYIEKVYNELFVSLGPGADAPSFTVNTLEGESLSLYDINAKYILVDFWASWCVPCRKSFPHLKKLYSKYKDSGFEVLAVDTADEAEKWKKAVEEDNTPWIHVIDEGADHQYGEVAQKYSVPFLPTTFLIDENKKIVARNLKKDDLNRKLEEVFGF